MIPSGAYGKTSPPLSYLEAELTRLLPPDYFFKIEGYFPGVTGAIKIGISHKNNISMFHWCYYSVGFYSYHAPLNVVVQNAFNMASAANGQPRVLLNGPTNTPAPTPAPKREVLYD